MKTFTVKINLTFLQVPATTPEVAADVIKRLIAAAIEESDLCKADAFHSSGQSLGCSHSGS